MSSLDGQSLGRYRILKELGTGGMATVYQAYDTRLERCVAIKIIRTERLTIESTPKALKRFEREAKALEKLTHPNIVPILDYGEHEGKPYLVMAYLPGGTLKQKLGKPIPWQESLKLLVPIAQALDFAHCQGVIHRDVKPSNILLTADGRLMLTDFGIAKLLDVEETLDLTGTSAVMGTPEYMAPEQTTARSADQRADIYALGIVLYEMITGRKPYTADTPVAVMIMHARDPLPRPSRFVRDVPDEVEKILLKALAKRPEDRFQSMAELQAELENLVFRMEGRGSASKQVKRLPANIRQGPAASLKPASKTFLGMPMWAWWSLLGLITIGLAVSVSNWIVPQSLNKATSQVSSPSAVVSSQIPSRATKIIPGLRSGSSWTRPADSMIMMYIPPGEFWMGTNTGEEDEKPLHMVYLDAFWIDQTEVTNRMYLLCVDAEVCEDPEGRISERAISNPGYPVVAGWNMAVAYCTWAGGRLPTEAEWEKAARGGLEKMKYPWGDETPVCKTGTGNGANFTGCEYQGVVDVKTFSPNRYGLYDMAGNVFEWVVDWYQNDYYAVSPDSNPQGPLGGRERILRGGAWINDESGIAITRRGRSDPLVSIDHAGFRCSRSVGPAQTRTSTPTPVPTFIDVPYSHWAHDYIEAIYQAGYTAGCVENPLSYCPDNILDRAQASVFIMRAMFGPDYTPAPPQGLFADDWSQGPWAEMWVEAIYNAGLSDGCATDPLRFCPWDIITHEQVAVLGLRMKHGNTYAPPPATGNVFADMTDTGDPETAWAEQAYAEGIVPDCGIHAGTHKPLFCPDTPVKRDLIAYVIVKAKGLPLPVQK